MKVAKKAARLLAAAALAGAGLIGASQAATISVVPSTQTVAPGGPASVDIVLSDAGQVIGGFSFLLSFNNSVLGGTGYTIGAGMGPSPLDLSNGFTGGAGSPLDMFVVADGALDEPSLGALQGNPFILATVNFNTLQEGLSNLTLSVAPSQGAFLSTFDGTGTVAATAVNGSICVDDPQTPGNRCTVPEPGTLALGALAVGMAALIGRRRRDLQPQD